MLGGNEGFDLGGGGGIHHRPPLPPPPPLFRGGVSADPTQTHPSPNEDDDDDDNKTCSPIHSIQPLPHDAQAPTRCCRTRRA